MPILNHTSIYHSPFRKFILKRLPLLTIFLLLTGCASIGQNISDAPAGSPRMAGDGNHYYNFIRSELETRNGRMKPAIDYMNKAAAAQPESVFLKKELVYLYLQDNDTDKALETIESILADHPEDIGSLIISGTIQKELGREDEAAAIFAKVLSLNPEQKKIYHVLGEYYIENKALDKAADVYTQMTRQFPEAWEGFFFLGKIQKRLNEFTAAEENFRHCLKLKNDLVSPRFELIDVIQKKTEAGIQVTVAPGDTLFSLCQAHYQEYNPELVEKIIAANPGIKDISTLTTGQELFFPGVKRGCDADCRQEVIDLFKSILNEYPDNYRAVMEFALFYYSTGNLQQGDALLAEIGRKSETTAQQVMQYVSQLFISRQRLDDARTVLNGMLKAAPENSDLHYLLGVIYDKQKQPAKALEHFSKIGEQSSLYTTTLLQMAFLHEEIKQPEKAKIIFERLLENEPDNVELLLYAGSFLERQEDYDRAESLYNRGIRIEPENVDLLFRLGVVYDKTGRKNDVIELMKEIIDIAPDDANALNYLGYTYADLGINLDEAQQLIEKALSLDPENGYITDSLGWVFYQKGNMEKAIELLTRANQLSPDDSILLEHLGDAYLKSCDTEKALDAYRKALEFAPENDREKLHRKINEILQPVGSQ